MTATLPREPQRVKTNLKIRI